jgi:hypothetical protein
MSRRAVETRWAATWAALALAVLMAGATACGEDQAPTWASARVVSNRDDLIGGPRALGEVGDFLLENDQIRVIIQGAGYSRGFGVFGGSLIDAELRRPRESGDSAGGVGHDSFGELFPSFFLQAVATDTVEVLSDGSDGQPAQIRVTGDGGDFLTMLGVLNRAAIGSNEAYLDRDSAPQVRYESIYSLSPGDRHVTVTFRLINTGEQELIFPGRDAETLLRLLGLDLTGFTLPVGDVALFGAMSHIFAPGVGFDLRFGLEAAYARGWSFPPSVGWSPSGWPAMATTV